jgi:hypothetical protein
MLLQHNLTRTMSVPTHHGNIPFAIMHCATCGASLYNHLNSVGRGQLPHCKICNSSKDRIQAADNTRFAIVLRRERRATFMMGASFASFIVGLLPIHILFIVNSTTDYIISTTAMNLGIWLILCHSACTPLIYIACNPAFGSAVRKYF